MYEPPHFVENDERVLHALIRAHPLGLLISATPAGPIADPIPFSLVETGKTVCLHAHLSRANPHWKVLRDSPEMPVLVVFQGSQSYITPSWYQTKRETGKVVPTWNYAIVQAQGVARVIEDTGWLARQIAELTASHESGRPEPWAISDAPQQFIEAQLKGIVGLEIEISSLSGKWKVSQNRPAADRYGVASGLSETQSGREMADLVRHYGKLED